MKRILSVLLIIAILFPLGTGHVEALSKNDIEYWFDVDGDLLNLKLSGYRMSMAGIDESLNRYVVVDNSKKAYLLKISKEGSLIFYKNLPLDPDFDYFAGKWAWTIDEPFQVVYKDSYIYISKVARYNTSNVVHFFKYRTNGAFIRESLKEVYNEAKGESAYPDYFRFYDVIDDHALFSIHTSRIRPAGGNYGGRSTHFYAHPIRLNESSSSTDILKRTGEDPQKKIIEYLPIVDSDSGFILKNAYDTKEYNYRLFNNRDIPNTKGSEIWWHHYYSNGYKTVQFMRNLDDDKLYLYAGRYRGSWPRRYYDIIKIEEFNRRDTGYRFVYQSSDSRKLEYLEDIPYGTLEVIPKNKILNILRNNIYLYDKNINILRTGTVGNSRHNNALKNENKQYLDENTFVLRSSAEFELTPSNTLDLKVYSIFNTAPTIDIAIPNNNQVFTKGSKVNLKAEVTDPDMDRMTYNIKIGTSRGAGDIYNGLPNSTKSSSYVNHTINTSNIELTWNSSTNRYEKKIWARVTVNDGSVDVYDDISFIVTNYRPSINITNASDIVKSSGNFTLTGRVWDGNRDRLTVRAKIGGQTKTAVVNNSPTSRPSRDNFTLNFIGLPEGKYKNIVVTVQDDKGGNNSTIWRGTLAIRDVLKDIDDKIKDKVLPKNKDVSVVVANTDSDITQNPSNDSLIGQIKNKINNRDSEMFFVGKDGATKNYIRDRLTKNYSYNQNESNIIDFIVEKSNELVQSDTDVFLVSDYLNYDMIFEDLEKDYEGISNTDKLMNNNILDNAKKMWKAGTLKIMYEHNPNIFDNPVTKHFKSDNTYHTILTPRDAFVINRAENSMRGKWTINLKASDTTGRDKFDKESDIETYNFIIHEKPVAKIGVFERANEWWLTGEDSYDIDYENTLQNNGIVKYEWSYLLKHGSWHKFSSNDKKIIMPKRISGQNVIGYSLTVTDFHGATDTTIEKNIISPGITSSLHSEDNKFNVYTGIPASEELKLLDIKTIPEAFDKIQFGIYQGGNLKKSYPAYYNPAHVTKEDILVAEWQDKRNMVIPSTLPDGNYTLKLSSNYGGTPIENAHSFKVFTPIDLVPKIPSKIQADTNIIIKAATTKYASAVTVDVFSDGNIKNMVLDREENGVKYWKLNYHMPINKPEGNHNATFKATTPNGNTEVKVLPFFLRVLDLKDLRITNMVNHIEYEGKYPIYYNNPEVPVNYKSGYYVTFKITAVGNPDQVQLRISYPGYAKTLNMTKESQSGSESTWVGEWYSDPKLKKGTIINTVATADKGTVHLNFNTKYGWNGDYLKVIGSIEGDWRIDQEL